MRWDGCKLCLSAAKVLWEEEPVGWFLEQHFVHLDSFCFACARRGLDVHKSHPMACGDGLTMTVLR